MDGVNLSVKRAEFTQESGSEAEERGQRKMADTSTKDTSASMKATPAGKNGSLNMPLGTNATTHTQTLKNVAEILVALELDLQEASKLGYRWQILPLARDGKSGLAIVLYHPEYAIGKGVLPSGNVVATIENEPAGVVATRKAE
jgi:hypothetical protein